MSRMRFEKFASSGKARRGRLHFPRGTVETPAFMPVGTAGTVKGLYLDQVKETGADIILHVRDIAHVDSDAQADDVLTVLGEIGVR